MSYQLAKISNMHDRKMTIGPALCKSLLLLMLISFSAATNTNEKATHWKSNTVKLPMNQNITNHNSFQQKNPRDRNNMWRVEANLHERCRCRRRRRGRRSEKARRERKKKRPFRRRESVYQTLLVINRVFFVSIYLYLCFAFPI